MPFGSADGKIFVADGAGTLSPSSTPRRASSGPPVGTRARLLALAPDGKRLVAANRESDSISVIDTKDFAVKATIGVSAAHPSQSVYLPMATERLSATCRSYRVTDRSRMLSGHSDRAAPDPRRRISRPGCGAALVVNQESGRGICRQRFAPAGCSSQSWQFSRRRCDHERQPKGVCRQLVVGRHGGRPGGGKGNRPHAAPGPRAISAR